MWLGSGVAVAAVEASSSSSDSTPSLGTSICCRCGPKNTHTHTEGKENTAGEVPASEDAADFVKWTLALLANFGLGIVTRIQWQLSE